MQTEQDQQQEQRCQTFVFNDEDTTLGASLCYCINQLPRSYHVSMCGYDIPHPANEQMQIRIQTTQQTNPTEALIAGCYSLIDIAETYEKQLENIQIQQ